MSETTSKNPRFARALRRMQETHDAKSHDYATTANPYANFDFAQTLVERFGEPQDQVFATMVAIKLARLGELLGRGKTPKHESIEDTFLDLANYVVLWWTSRQRLADDAGASGPEPGVSPDSLGLSRSELEHWASMQPHPSTSTYVSDGSGRMWLRCSPTCDLHVERPGHMTCRCHATRFSNSV